MCEWDIKPLSISAHCSYRPTDRHHVVARIKKMLDRQAFVIQMPGQLAEELQ